MKGVYVIDIKDGKVVALAKCNRTADERAAVAQSAPNDFPFQLWVGRIFYYGYENAVDVLRSHSTGMSIRCRDASAQGLLDEEKERQRQRRAELTATIARLSDEHAVRTTRVSKWARPFLEVSDELADARVELSASTPTPPPSALPFGLASGGPASECVRSPVSSVGWPILPAIQPAASRDCQAGLAAE